jgi:hypothetical protein
MFYVGIAYRKPTATTGQAWFLRVRSELFDAACIVAFNEKHARVAVRRYIKGNLSAALACMDDGANEPADATKQYGRALRRQFMLPGTGPGGFFVDYGSCQK